MTSLEQWYTPEGVSYLTSGKKSRLGLVCIHGWGCRASDFTLLFQELNRKGADMKLLAIDLPGHGDSPKELCPDASVSGCARAALSVVQYESLSEIILCGHSMGGRMVMDAFTQARAKGAPVVKSVVFLDVSNYRLRPKLYEFDEKDPRSKAMTEPQKAIKKAEMFQSMFSSETPLDFELATLNHLKTLDRNFANAIRENYIRYDHEDLNASLAIVGECGIRFCNLQSTDIDGENQRFPLKSGQISPWMQLIQEKVPHAQQIVVEDSAHFPHVDQPQRVANLVLDFVQDFH
ncbi:hypothetical protein LTR56_018012 [Elasticomyces elasticus]|nr:hypothetical protein LTR56_018012 [Elasticomyces elasticus]KAK4915897.1 hypothetical protein LTR49_016043 [Elasticomyces elasticus]KAK5755343.1 hypothetical protein LTS12_014572 [Elasticomyces elasticus]